VVGDERLEAREGGGRGVDCIEAVVSPPASEGLSQGVAGHWPRCGALGLGKSSVSSGTMRRHTKPCLSLYLFLSFFFLFSRKSNSREPLRLGDADEFATLPLRSAISSSSVALSTDWLWLHSILVGSDVSEPRRINAGTLRLPVKFEVLALSTSSLLLKEVVLIVEFANCSTEVVGFANLIQRIAVIAYHSASLRHGTHGFLGVRVSNPCYHTHRGWACASLHRCHPQVAVLCCPCGV